MEGYLYKKSSGFTGSYQKRYFKLENYILSYMEKETDRQPKEKIDLRETKSIIQQNEKRSGGEYQKEFTIVTTRREYQLRAPTVTEKETWLNFLYVFHDFANSSPNSSIPIPQLITEGILSAADACATQGKTKNKEIEEKLKLTRTFVI